MLNTKKLNTKILEEIATNGITVGSLSNIDLNDVKETGLYEIQSNIAHSPSTWVWMLVIGGAGTVQIVFAQTYIYVRAYTGSPLNWTAWRRVGLNTY